MRAFVTGVTGFAGGWLAEHLLAEGDLVLGCSASALWPPWASQTLKAEVQLVHWDIGDPAGLTADPRNEITRFAPECIYHLAAISVPDECGLDQPTARAIAVNVDGTARVLELAAALPRCSRILFTSTSHVYAPVEEGRCVVDENSPLGPVRGYGRTKLAAEALLRHAVSEGEADVIIARAFQHTGPRQRPPLMVPQWAEQFGRGNFEPIRVKNPNTFLDLSDVRDVVRAYRLLVKLAEPGGVYNVGSGRNVCNGDVLAQLVALAGGAREIEAESRLRRQDAIADVHRLQERTGWSPRIPLEQTVADVYEYWRKPFFC